MATRHTIALLAVLALGCTKVAVCRPGTVLLAFALPATTSLPAQLEVTVVIDGVKKISMATTSAREGTIEVRFPAGYPRGQNATFSIQIVGGGSSLISTTSTLNEDCSLVTLSPIDAGDASVDAASDLASNDQSNDLSDRVLDMSLIPSEDLSSVDLVAHPDLAYRPLVWTTQTSAGSGPMPGCTAIGDEAWIAGFSNEVFYTANRGNDWSPRNLAATNAYSAGIWATAPNALYVVGITVGAQTFGVVYKSSDKGMTWDPSYSSQNKSIKDIHGSTSNIFAGGEDGVVLRSTNAGSSWPQATAVNGSATVSGIYVASDGTVFATAGGESVSRSFDNGTSWVGKKAAPTGGAISDIHGVDAAHVWVVGTVTASSTPFAAYTDDGGQNWNSVALPPGPTAMSALVMQSANDVVMVGKQGYVYHFFNGVVNPETSNTSADLTGVCSSGPTTYYAVGANGTIIHGE